MPQSTFGKKKRQQKTVVKVMEVLTKVMATDLTKDRDRNDAGRLRKM